MGFSQTQEGRGTWYETDSKGLAASHANLPFGTRVRVTNLQNDRQVIVTINNRIVDTPNRIIDISKAAADNLEMSPRGTTPVRIEVLSRRRVAEPETPPTQTVEVPPPEPAPVAVVPEPEPEPPPVTDEEELVVTTTATARRPQQQPKQAEPSPPQPTNPGGNVTQTIITINGLSPYSAGSDPGTVSSISTAPGSAQAPMISGPEGAQVVAGPAPSVVAPAPAVVSPNPSVVAPTPAMVSPSPVVVSPAPAIIAPVVIPPVVAQPVLAQPILTPPVVAPPIVSEPIVSEPVVAPTVTVEPMISTPTKVSPMVSSPQTLSPQTLSPQTLSPQTPFRQGGVSARVLPRMPSPGSPGIYAVQVGAFMSERNAAEAYRRVAETGLQPSYERYGDYIRVIVSGVRAADLEAIAMRLGSANFQEVLIREIR
ncbi:MAG: SPOR domain-containing protein [Spirochaetaceae bacterium]|nr:SPOR domain-containing protein [Spirochaetaceae bacterium]